jgi:hypothetical protein
MMTKRLMEEFIIILLEDTVAYRLRVRSVSAISNCHLDQ